MSPLFVLLAGIQGYGYRIVYEPPVLLARAQMLGHTPDQILAMGFDKRSDSAHRNPRFAVGGVDRDRDVWGYCLRRRNNRSLLRLPKKSRIAISKLRTHLFNEEMDAIRSADLLGHGGTYATHAVHNAFISSEQATCALIKRFRPVAMPEQTLEETFQMYRKDHNPFAAAAWRELRISVDLGRLLGPRGPDP